MVDGHEVVDRLPELPGRRKTGTFESLAAQNAAPALPLIEPGGVRGRGVEMHLGVSFCASGLPWARVYSSGPARHAFRGRDGGGYDFIHNIQEFPPATPGVVPGLD
jgi:hypothetical protein